MRNLAKRGIAAALAPAPAGLAFEISDLVLSKAWADFHRVRMSVRLDHRTKGEEYEEVIEFYTELRPLRRLFIWRNAQAVVTQPLIGIRQRYRSLALALERLVPMQRVELTDIVVKKWPVND